MTQARRSRIQDPTRQFFFSIYLIPSAALGLGIHSASNRNEYQKQKIAFLGSRARPMRWADNITGNYEPTLLTMWDPHHLTTL
jgi:hypothetical protein